MKAAFGAGIKTKAISKVHFKDVENKFTHFSFRRSFIVGVVPSGIDVFEVDLDNVTVLHLGVVDLIKVVRL